MMLSVGSGCDATANTDRAITAKLMMFDAASHGFLENYAHFPQKNGNTWFRDHIPKFKTINYRCAIMAADAQLGDLNRAMTIEEQTRQVIETGKSYFESGRLRLYANFEGIESAPNPYYDGPVFLYAVFLQYDVGSTWWDDPLDQLSFKEIVERSMRCQPKQPIFVLLNDGQIRSFRPANWEKVTPILDPYCSEVERNQALGFLKKER